MSVTGELGEPGEPGEPGDEGEHTLPHGPSRAPAALPTHAQLIIVYPPELQKTIQLSSHLITLGRHAADAGHALRHPTVSRAHLELGWDPRITSYTARDLGSHNGSSIDGVRLRTAAHALHPNAILRLGDVLAVFEPSASHENHDEREALVDRAAIPGEAGATRALRFRIARAAADPAPALLVGETGTGKERLAGELHRLSGRPGPLVPVNCAALSAHLVESQLLGHVRGAFTGAQADQPGLIRSAAGGTIFFDEVGELPLELQPKLLRVVQEREVLPVGSARAVKVDVRMIAASNRDLARLVDEGGFRRDLYARLAMWEIRVPPLRERRADLLVWLHLLHARHRRERGLPDAPLRLGPEIAERILLDPWPDNLRGLDRLVHELGDGTELTTLPEWMHPATTSPPREPPGPPAPSRQPAPTREELAVILERHGGSVRATAKHFNRDRRQIYRWIEAYGLRINDPETTKD